ncbi:MAG: cytochrome family protein [Frankiales bacterium]|nr:cytochrome family protein [Frankiales bacterium]
MTVPDSSFDNLLLDPEWYAADGYHSVFRRLRDEDPIHWTNDEKFGKSYWSVSRHSDIKDCLEDHERLSNRWQSRVPMTPKRYTPEQRYEMGFDVSIPFLDEPTHSLYRRPLNKHFSVPSVARLREYITAFVDEVIDDVRQRESVDIVEDVAGGLPMRVIFTLLGIPSEDWPALMRAAGRVGAPSDERYNDGVPPQDNFTGGLREISEYGLALAKKRREQPADDFVTAIAKAEIDGDPLSDREVQWWIVQIIRAGTETTKNAAAVGLYLFLQNPDEAQRLRADPTLAPGAVEEALRLITPARNRLRIANERLTIGDRTVAPGDWVVLFLHSGNRDERVFSDPDRFDITRTPNDHLSFSGGIHGCMGRNLARLELQILYSRFLEAFPEIELLEDAPDWVPDASATGLRRLNVKLGAR